MSGGYWDYTQQKILEIADGVSSLIENNNSAERDSWGDPIGMNFSPDVIARFREAETALRQAYIYAHRLDWLLSGDDGELEFLNRLARDLEEAT